MLSRDNSIVSGRDSMLSGDNGIVEAAIAL